MVATREIMIEWPFFINNFFLASIVHILNFFDLWTEKVLSVNEWSYKKKKNDNLLIFYIRNLKVEIFQFLKPESQIPPEGMCKPHYSPVGTPVIVWVDDFLEVGTPYLSTMSWWFPEVGPPLCMTWWFSEVGPPLWYDLMIFRFMFFKSTIVGADWLGICVSMQ